MRPYIICHMMASLDGRIDCAMTEQIEGGDEYYDALALLECPSTLMGRVTMAMHYAADGEYKATDNTPVGRPCHNVACRDESYIIAVDTMGRLVWSDTIFDGMPLLVITSEKCPRERLDALTAQGISWIAAGENGVNLAGAMEVLGTEFGVRRLSVTGGGLINAAFLTAGLLDEVSMMYAPGIDGRAGMTAAFDGIADRNHAPVKLTLTAVERMGQTVWMRYIFRNGRE